LKEEKANVRAMEVSKKTIQEATVDRGSKREEVVLPSREYEKEKRGITNFWGTPPIDAEAEAI